MSDEKELDSEVNKVKNYLDPFDPEKDITTFSLRKQVTAWDKANEK